MQGDGGRGATCSLLCYKAIIISAKLKPWQSPYHITLYIHVHSSSKLHSTATTNGLQSQPEAYINSQVSKANPQVSCIIRSGQVRSNPRALPSQGLHTIFKQALIIHNQRLRRCRFVCCQSKLTKVLTSNFYQTP